VGTNDNMDWTGSSIFSKGELDSFGPCSGSVSDCGCDKERRSGEGWVIWEIWFPVCFAEGREDVGECCFWPDK